MVQKKNIIYDIAITSLFTALIVLSSWISVSVFSVPFTLQTLGVFTAVAVLGFKRGVTAVSVYILLGVVGLPVFHGFQGGVGVLLGSTGGFILGFLISPLVIGIILNKKYNSIIRLIAAFVLAQLVCYVLGVMWFCYVFQGGEGIDGVVLSIVVPFLLPDVLKILAAAVISKRVSKYVK